MTAKRGRVSMAAGFSLVELLMATSLLLVVMSGVFQVLDPAQGSFRVEPERSDLGQRLRVAVDTLSRDIRAAGTGVSQGLRTLGPLKQRPGPIGDVLPPVLPFRQGRRSPDGPGVFRRDAITVWRAVGGAAQSTLAQALGARTGTVQVSPDPGCPPEDPPCGFRSGMDVLVFDGTGAYDAYSVTSVEGAALSLRHNTVDSSRSYAASTTRVVEASSRTFYLRLDRATDTSQLVQYDGGGGQDVPVVDHVVGLSFEYFGDPRPPEMRAPLTDPAGPWTTYGPVPPSAGGNCVFLDNGTPMPTPRLAVLEDTLSGRVPLTAAMLTDGPWCPDASDPNRYDADLFRIRSVVVTLRVEVASASLRGPAGLLFSRGGTGRAERGLVPDEEVRFEVVPANLAFAR